MCHRPRPDRAPAIARFLIASRLTDQAAKTCAIMERFPGATYAEVMRAEAIALDAIKARLAGMPPLGLGSSEMKQHSGWGYRPVSVVPTP